MKKLFKTLLYSVISLIMLYLILFTSYYYKTHYKFQIDNRFAIVDHYNDGDGFYLVDNSKKSSTSSLLVEPPIVWYCFTKNYIFGCVGENISNQSEAYIPSCQKNGYFIIEKKYGNVIKNIHNNTMNKILQDKNLKCKKIFIY